MTTKEFIFDKNDTRYKVWGQLIDESTFLPSGTKMKTVRMTSLQLFSEEGQMSSSYDGSLGELFTDEFNGYTLSRVTGRVAGQHIHQFQFVWYHTIDVHSPYKLLCY